MTAIRIIAGIITIGHGLIHLMGFVKALKLAEIKELKLEVSQSAGLLWLATASLFVATAVMFLGRIDWWWLLAIPAILLSQVMVVNAWKDAKFGTIANLIVVAMIVLDKLQVLDW